MTDYVSRLNGLIKNDRIQAAKSLLADVGSRPKADQEAVIEMLALASDATGLALIDFLMAGPLEPSIQDRLFQLATDRAHLHYDFAAPLLAHGTLDQIRHTIPLLKHILSKATAEDLLNRILRECGKLRLEQLTDDVAEFIFYDDDDLKRQSVKALERIGNKTALKHLEHIAGTDKCDMDILDAIDMIRKKLGTKDAVKKESPQAASPKKTPPRSKQKTATPLSGDRQTQLRHLTSGSLEQRLAAYNHFCDSPDLVAGILNDHLDTENHDLLLNLLRLTARTIPQNAVDCLFYLITRDDLAPSLTLATLTALTAFPELESAAIALKLAESASMAVRLTAVKTLDRHCSDYIAAEIKNRVEAGTKKAEALGKTILDAGATRLMEALKSSDTFSYIASNYLEHSAPVQAIDAYIQVLENRNQTATAKKYTRIRTQRAKQKRRFFVIIHPTQAYLDVYTKIIHNCGFDTRCFSAPQKAFESIVFEKPAAVICGLFIGQIGALELAREIRELYSENQVPIIVSTRHQDLDKAIVHKELTAAGINSLCGYPATPAQIKSWGKGQ